MPPAARLGDKHTCPNTSSGGTVIEGAGSVFINGKPAARLNDACKCGDGPSHVGSASPTVFIEGRAAARIGDTTCHHGVVVEGSTDVIIGDGGGPAGAMATARSNAAPFVRP